MPNKKRGQVTVFVALGAIVALALILAIAFRGDIAKIVTEGASQAKTGFSAQVEEVRGHVEDCLKNSLSEAIVAIANEKTDDYNKRLEEEVMLNMEQCLDLTRFKDVTTKKLAEPELEVQRNTDNTVITATLTLPISVEKNENKEQLSEFIAQENLKEKPCILKEQLDSDCRAKQDLQAGIFIFKAGQEATIGGECLAC